MDDRTTGTVPEVRLGPLADSLGFLLRLAQLRNFAAFYAALGTLELRPGAFTVLLLIGENPGIRQGVLARALMIKRAHMTKMIRAMETEGLLRRTVPPTDRRSVELWLTEAGTARLGAIRAPFAAFENRSAAGLTPAEDRQLKHLLQKTLGLPPAGGRT
jgi:DNA-binding MarR family transcriptional regulator